MAETPMVWVLEDDEGEQFYYREVLALRYKIALFASTEQYSEALREVENGTTPLPQLLIADLRLPGESFISHLRKHRGFYPLPTIIVSAQSDPDVLRLCFEKGVRDYLVKPFSTHILSLKVERFLNEAAPVQELQRRSTTVHIDPVALTAMRERKTSSRLTAREFQILSALCHDDSGSSRRELLRRVWSDVSVEPKTLDVHLSSLRKKLMPLRVEISQTSSDRFRLVVH